VPGGKVNTINNHCRRATMIKQPDHLAARTLMSNIDATGNGMTKLP
jgi:hypothetical protein